jgi:hypothetical protein
MDGGSPGRFGSVAAVNQQEVGLGLFLAKVGLPSEI